MSEPENDAREKALYSEGLEVGLRIGRRLSPSQHAPLIAKWREVATLEKKDDAAVGFAYARCATELECFVGKSETVGYELEDAGYLVALEVMGEFWLEDRHDKFRREMLERFVERFVENRAALRHARQTR